MGWLQILFYIIVNIPKFISLIRQILDLIHGAPKSVVHSVREQLSEAIAQHRLDKDDSKLERVLCEGVACVSNTKGLE